MFGNIDWRPDSEKIRKFAITLIILALLLGLALLWKGRAQTALWVTGSGMVLAGLSFFYSPIGRIVYVCWMGITYLLGRIISPVVIGVIFFLVVTPVGLIMRLSGRDSLKLKKPQKKVSYFVEIEKNSEGSSFERQF